MILFNRDGKKLSSFLNLNYKYVNIVMICHWAMPEFDDNEFPLIGWYADLNDVLENCIIDGRKFKDVIMDDSTKIEAKD